jgi:SAM-dependent methyltransferase
VRTLQADLDAAWPAVDGADLVWAASSLHEFGDQDRVLRDVLAALNPGGLLVVIEMDTLPRFLPHDLGRGRPGLELRCHEMLARMGWNRHPDWQPHLERAGFGIAARRSFTVASSPAPPGTGRYAQAFLGRVRSVLDGWLAAEDLTTLDDLLDGGSPAGLLRRPDLALRARRTAWAGRSPLDPAA